MFIQNENKLYIHIYTKMQKTTFCTCIKSKLQFFLKICKYFGKIIKKLYNHCFFFANY